MPNKTRTAIFAHFDKDNVIDDYVIYYLNALKKIAQKLIFVSDCNLSAAETDKLTGIADEIIAKPHGEHDFGSYKRGFLFAQENNLLNDTDELIFANDSCYGPFFPLENVFEKMEQENCNFWGITQNNKFKIFNTKLPSLKHLYPSPKSKISTLPQGKGNLFQEKNRSLNENLCKFCFGKTCEIPHIQSYFFVLKKEVFSHPAFLNFIKSIKKEKSRNEVILKYEIGLSELLLNNKADSCNFVMKSFIEAYQDESSPFLHRAQELILNHGMPFLKCAIPRGRYVGLEVDLAAIAKVPDYPIEMIDKHAERTKISHFFLLNWLKKLKKMPPHKK